MAYASYLLLDPVVLACKCMVMAMKFASIVTWHALQNGTILAICVHSLLL